MIAGTRVAAELLKWDDKLGTIEKGKTADIIAVKGNPLGDITLLEHVKVTHPHQLSKYCCFVEHSDLTFYLIPSSSFLLSSSVRYVRREDYQIREVI